MTDPLENRIAGAFDAAGIHYVRESKESKFLDFYLPDFDVYVEVKGGTTSRVNKQCARDHNVIVVQGVKSAQFLCELLCSKL